MPRNEISRPYDAGTGNLKPPRWAVPDMSDGEYSAWRPVESRLLCGCEPHGHKCLISEDGCGRCVEHCVCTPSGATENGAGRAEDTGSPGTPPFRRRR